MWGEKHLNSFKSREGKLGEVSPKQDCTFKGPCYWMSSCIPAQEGLLSQHAGEAGNNLHTYNLPAQNLSSLSQSLKTHRAEETNRGRSRNKELNPLETKLQREEAACSAEEKGALWKTVNHTRIDQGSGVPFLWLCKGPGPIAAALSTRKVVQ